MLLQVTLVLPPQVAGTPSPLACVLTVVLELGHPYTKSLSLSPALWTSLPAAHQQTHFFLTRASRNVLLLPLLTLLPRQVVAPSASMPTPCSSQPPLLGLARGPGGVVKEKRVLMRPGFLGVGLHAGRSCRCLSQHGSGDGSACPFWCHLLLTRPSPSLLPSLSLILACLCITLSMSSPCPSTACL